jgi:hypothetical protein
MNELNPAQGGRKDHDGSRTATLSSCPGLHLLLFLIAWIAATFAVAQVSGTKESPPSALPGMDVRIKANPPKATIGDPIRMELEVLLPRGFEIHLPRLEEQIGDFSVLEVFPGPIVPAIKQTGKATAPEHPAKQAPGESVPFRARIVVAVYKTGEFTFPSLDLALRDTAGKETALPTPSVKVLIQSVLAQNDQTLADLKKQADIPEPSRWLLWLAFGLLALIAGALAWWFFRRRARARVAPSSASLLDPLDRAEAEMRDLLGRGFLEKRLIKQFYVALSDIMKQVLEAGYDVAAVEKTTDEILAELREVAMTGSIPAEELETIASFLGASDLVKFAKYIPSNTENEAAIRNVYQVLSLCRRRKGSLAAPAPVQVGGGA